MLATPPEQDADVNRAPEGEVRRPNTPVGAVTLRDVARAAGVSMITVSRVLREPLRVAEPTRESVRAAVARLGYVPNLAAGNLRGAPSRLIMALVPSLAGSLFAGMLTALTAALREQGFQLVVGETGYGEWQHDDLLRAIIGRRPDGIVLVGVVHAPHSRRLLVASGIPVIETWDTTQEPVDMLLRLSHAAIGEAVARYLHTRGRRRFAVLSGDDARAEQRSDQFCKIACSLGLPEPARHRVAAATTHARGREGLVALLEQDPAIDAVFCSSDIMAAGVLTEAVQRGIRVPEDLAVVGFGNMDIASSMVPAITTVHVDGTAIGTRAARMLAARAQGQTVAQALIDIDFQLIERESA